MGAGGLPQTEIDHELPTGTIQITGTDVGIKGAVAVVVDGKQVCQLHVVEAELRLSSLMGRMATTLAFPDGQVEWRG